MKAKHDDGLEWLRDIRRRLAKKFDHDPKKAGDEGVGGCTRGAGAPQSNGLVPAQRFRNR